MQQILIFAFALLAGIPSAISKEKELIPGPISAIVEHVVDGDTLAVRAHIWVGQDVRVLVRVEGVDTPELSGRCNLERQKARDARKFVAKQVIGKPITLSNIRRGKYAGRVIAKITLPDGQDLTESLLRTGYGAPYKKRRNAKWCCDNGKCQEQAPGKSKFWRYFSMDNRSK